MKSTTQNIKAIRLQFGELTITAEVEARLEELEHFKDCYVGEYDSEEEFPPIRSELLRGRTRIRRRVL